MGYESYKLTAKFQNTTSTELKNELIGLGARQVEEFGNNITLEIERESGIIEIILNDVTHRNLDFSPAEKVRVHILFSKSSEVRLLYQIMSIVHTLAMKHQLVYLRDETANMDVDCDHYGLLTGSVIKAKREFETVYPKQAQSGNSREQFFHCMSNHQYIDPDRVSC
jgi:hypothetical protein